MGLIGDFILVFQSWNKYKGYVKELTESGEHDLLEKLYRRKKEYGVVEGMQVFGSDYIRRRNVQEVNLLNERRKQRMKKQSELSTYSYRPKVTLEDIVRETEKQKQLIEESKNYKFDPNFNPTYEEIINANYPIEIEKKVSDIMHCKIYHVKEKMVYVGVSVVPGFAPKILVRENFHQLMKTMFMLFDSFDKNLGKVQNKPTSVDIDHVREALGLNEDKKDNSAINKKIDDIF